MKRVALVLGSLLVILVLLGFTMFMIGGAKVGQTYELPNLALAVSADSALVARGEHLSRAFGCTDCHTEDLGGQILIDAPPFFVVAPNLTPAGVVGPVSDAQLEHAIRHGVRSDGTSLMIMPSRAYHGMADEDVAAIISYMRTIPAVENDLGKTRFRALGRILSMGPIDSAFEVNLDPSPTSRPEVAATVEYGAYLHGAVCHYCHGEDARGMEKPPIPESPPAPDLSAAGNWTLEQFVEAMRSGLTPAGTQLDNVFMPYEFFGELDDAELEALHLYFGTL